MVDMTDAVAPGGKNAKLFGILTIVLGLLSLAAPLAAGISIALLVGLLVLFGGIARMVWAFQASSVGKGLFGFGIGLLTILCGVVLVTDPLVASGLLTVLITAYLLLDGVLEVLVAFQVRPAKGWGWLLAGGILSILLGFMIWQQFPLSGAWAIGILFGIKLLFVGMIMIRVGSTARSDT